MVILYILIFIATFFFMEFMAWFTHKYVMHGFLWTLHRDHHVPEKGFFERNDSFFLIFAVPSWLFIMLGMLNGYDFKFWIGIGIAAYGVAYFLVHDVLIHQRFKFLRKVKHPYFKALRRAHKMHHKHLGKEDGECFGMLVIPWKYYQQALDAERKQSQTA